jgi:hypothetical protein
MNSRKLLIGCGIALLALGVVVIGVIASFFIPKTNQQLPPGAFSILVNINLPLNGAELPLNEPVSIYAEAIGDKPVHSLELWVDGTFSPTKMDSSPADKSPLTATWLWTPAEEGVHRLIVRAIGPGGEVINSNVVRISVLPREKITDLQVTPIPPEQLPPNEPPAANTDFQVPEGPTVAPPPPPFPPQDPPQVPAEPPTGAPGLQGSINQCDATLFIQDNAEDEKGFYLYRFDPTSTTFTRVATLDKHPGTDSFNYLDPSLSLGNHTYYIASFDGSGESPSNLINLNVSSAQCAANGPQSFGLQDAILTTTQTVDKIYCYLSVDQGPWKRIPYGSNKFIYADAKGFDLSKYLGNLISPPPGGSLTLELECWGWSGDTLVYLGYQKQTIDKGPVQLIGMDFNLIGKLGITGPETVPFTTSPLIAAPRSLYFKNYNDCVSFFQSYSPSNPANECKFLNKGWLLLTWQWNPYHCWTGDNCNYIKDIDDYRLYQVYPGNEPVQVSTNIYHLHVDGGGQVALTFFTPATTQNGLIGAKYFVRAYKGNLESPDSYAIPAPSPQYQYTKVLPSSMMFQDTTYQADFIGSCPAYGPNFQDDMLKGGGSVVVGFNYQAKYTYSDDCPVMRSSDYYDATIYFDHREIHGQVNSAILHWTELSGTWIAKDPRRDLGCLIPLLDQNGAIIANYPLDGATGIDVTPQVAAWVKGLPNKGFRLLSGDRTLALEPIVPAFNVCDIVFGNFGLEVTYTTQKPEP